MLSSSASPFQTHHLSTEFFMRLTAHLVLLGIFGVSFVEVIGLSTPRIKSQFEMHCDASDMEKAIPAESSMQMHLQIEGVPNYGCCAVPATGHDWLRFGCEEGPPGGSANGVTQPQAY